MILQLKKQIQCKTPESTKGVNKPTLHNAQSGKASSTINKKVNSDDEIPNKSVVPCEKTFPTPEVAKV